MATRISPVIKWTGSKRDQAAYLSTLFPAHDRYFDPFLGGGALLPYAKAGERFASDVMAELIGIWRIIQSAPQLLIDGYRERWAALQCQGAAYYNAIRERFNLSRDPIDFAFLSRTAYNGLIRFNRAGEFNAPFHHTRPGIHPDRYARIVCQWNEWVRVVRFDTTDYREALEDARAGDFVFLDPPYIGSGGLYAGEFDHAALYDTLRDLSARGVKWMLTLDGEAQATSQPVPGNVYAHTFQMPPKHSPYRRLQKNKTFVTDSVFVNYPIPV